MKHFRALSLTSLFAICASPALADLTADNVLDDLLRQIEAGGLTATVEGRSRSGGSVSVDSITFAGEMEEGQLTATMGGATFVELGDGTVRIDYPVSQTIDVSFSDSENDFAVTATMTHSGLTYLASGSPQSIRYDYSAESLTISDVALTAPAEAADVPFDFALDIVGMDGWTELGSGTVRDYSADFSIDAISANFNFADPEGENGQVAFQLSLADLAGAMSGAVAAVELDSSAADSIAAGNRSTGKFTHGAMAYGMNANGPDGPLSISATTASGDVEFDFGAAGLSYAATSGASDFSIFGGAIPLPISMAFQATSGRMLMPLVPSDEPQDFSLSFSLDGLTIDEMLWGMFDPAGQLPRDPATISVDMAGMVTVLEDFTASDYGTDPEAMGMPGTIETLKLNGVELSLAGASLTGNGDFAFNNEFGMPMPAGIANFRLTGANALMDTLVAMGLLPEEQAMGARMMLSMFARPDGEDALTSTIEVNEDGSVLANGQRIK